jgi:hypothetical protein
MRNHFLHPQFRKKRLGQCRLIVVWSNRLALRTHILSWRLKNRLWWSRWSDVSRCRKAIRTLSCIQGIEKSDLNRVACNVLIRRMGLRTNNLPSERRKMRLRWCRWSDILWCWKAIRKHFLYFPRSKSVLCEVAEVLLYWRMALKTYNLSFDRLKKRLCWSLRSDISKYWNAIRIRFLHPEHRQKRLGGNRSSII